MCSQSSLKGRACQFKHFVQAKEFGEAEVWMNERLMRAAPQYFAEFITAFEDNEQRIGPQRGPVRLSTAPFS